MNEKEMTMSEAKMVSKHDGLELESCGRCGGSGRYSWCQMHGDTCFGCGGTGVRLTKRGAMAKAFLEAIRSKPVADLKVGDEIRLEPSPFSRGGWAKIAEIRPDFSQVVNGVPVDGLICLEFVEGGSYGGLRGSDLKRVRQTPEQVETTRIRALAFEASLTKTGKPRKA